VEEEGDWICVGVIDEHKGTVWDLEWEPYINYSVLDLSASDNQEKSISEFENDWEPRLISCSDDLSVRIFRRELSETEKARKNQRRETEAAPTGFMSSRLPSVIRPQSSMEQWVQDAVLPEVHVRSIYAVDWSRNTGLVVTCGGDGTIAVYKEVPVEEKDVGTAARTDVDVEMNGTTSAQADPEAQEATPDAPGAQAYKLHKMKWIVVAQIDCAHEEYEVNHVCWAERRDKDRREGEEVIVSTGDEGDVRIWTLPEGVQ
jgi:WD40 repeat protein